MFMQTAEYRERLEKHRDQLEAALKTCSENMLPQLSGQYRATLADLAGLPSEGKAVSKRDELANRRTDRVADAAPVADARKGGRKRG